MHNIHLILCDHQNCMYGSNILVILCCVCMKSYIGVYSITFWSNSSQGAVEIFYLDLILIYLVISCTNDLLLFITKHSCRRLSKCIASNQRRHLCTSRVLVWGKPYRCRGGVATLGYRIEAWRASRGMYCWLQPRLVTGTLLVRVPSHRVAATRLKWGITLMILKGGWTRWTQITRRLDTGVAAWG